MPPRTTRKSYRPRVSDRTMVGTCNPLCLLRPENRLPIPNRDEPEKRNPSLAITVRAGFHLDLQSSAKYSYKVSLEMDGSPNYRAFGGSANFLSLIACC